MQELKIHGEFQTLIPPLDNEEFKQLEANIKQDGCRDPLVVWNGYIIDGHNRYDICTRNGIGFETVTRNFKDFTEAKVWIIRNQFGRRNLSAYDRSKLALKLEDYFKEKGKTNQVRTSENRVSPILAKQDTRKEIAKIAGVSHGTLGKVKTIESEATEQQKQDLEGKKKSINKVYGEIKESKLSDEEKAKRARMREANKVIKEANKNPRCMHPKRKTVEICQHCGEILESMEV